jgi:hypothetical protein
MGRIIACSFERCNPAIQKNDGLVFLYRKNLFDLLIRGDIICRSVAANAVIKLEKGDLHGSIQEYLFNIVHPGGGIDRAYSPSSGRGSRKPWKGPETRKRLIASMPT